MNDPVNLSYYSQLLVFRGNSSKENITLKDLDRQQQRSLHYLADEFGFEYEYSRVTKTVTISRLECQVASASPQVRDERLGNSSTSVRAIDASQRHKVDFAVPSQTNSSPQLHSLKHLTIEPVDLWDDDFGFLNAPLEIGNIGFDLGPIHDQCHGSAELPHNATVVPEHTCNEPEQDHMVSGIIGDTQCQPTDDMSPNGILNPTQLNGCPETGDTESHNSPSMKPSKSIPRPRLPQPMAFIGAASTQRTAIACRYCRRRKVSEFFPVSNGPKRCGSFVLRTS